MIDITEPLVTSRFKVTDFKRSCVLNSNATFEALNGRVTNRRKNGYSKKSNSSMRSKKLKKF